MRNNPRLTVVALVSMFLALCACVGQSDETGDKSLANIPEVASFDSWHDVMEWIGELYYGPITAAGKSSTNAPTAALVNASRRAAEVMRLGAGRRLRPKTDGDRFAELSTQTSDFFVRVADTIANDPSRLAELLKGSEARYCTRCHEQFQ